MLGVQYLMAGVNCFIDASQRQADMNSYLIFLIIFHLCFDTLSFLSPYFHSNACSHFTTANWVTQFCHFWT